MHRGVVTSTNPPQKRNPKDYAHNFTWFRGALKGGVKDIILSEVLLQARGWGVGESFTAFSRDRNFCTRNKRLKRFKFFSFFFCVMFFPE